MDEALVNVLRRHRLHITGARISILSLFEKLDDGLTCRQIERYLGESADRATIYRTLQLFLKKGIIHCVPTTSAIVVYALCRMRGPGSLSDHAHFICEGCGKTYCLEATGIPEVHLPENFSMTGRDLVMRGKCDSCK